MPKRLDASRHGYALALCLMPYPGRSLEQGEALPVQIVGYVARQLGIAPGVFDNSPDRDKERRKHLADAMRRFGYRPFDRAVLKDLIGWLTPSAQVARAAVLNRNDDRRATPPTNSSPFSKDFSNSQCIRPANAVNG